MSEGDRRRRRPLDYATPRPGPRRHGRWVAFGVAVAWLLSLVALTGGLSFFMVGGC